MAPTQLSILFLLPFCTVRFIAYMKYHFLAL
jgi:hypothetical protein